MKVDFYEEFPTKENLDKLKLIDFKIRLFIAAKSLDEFKNIEKKVKEINKNVECAYWPIIPHSYWISSFSYTEDLIKTFNELERCNNHLLIDLEPPFLNKKLMIKNIFKIWKNKKLIKRFLEKNKDKITTAQIAFRLFNKILGFFGLDYDIKTEKSIMWYSSKMKKGLINIKDKENYSVSLGTIAVGISGNEPILSPNKLGKDFEFVKKAGFKKVIIFRLGGLNKEYLSIIKKYL